jgi:ribosomal protein S18 acetylase RimI-like enzyme
VSCAAFSIRRAREADLPETAALFEAVANAAMPWLTRETQDAAAFLAAAREEIVFIAEAESRIVGLASLYEPDSFLHALFIAADWQGRGVGRALLAMAAREAAAPLSLKVQSLNTAARRFYARAGFTEADSGTEDGFTWIRLVAPN